MQWLLMHTIMQCIMQIEAIVAMMRSVELLAKYLLFISLFLWQACKQQTTMANIDIYCVFW